MADVNVVIADLDKARSSLNTARNLAEEWRKGVVASVPHTSAQTDGLISAFEAAIDIGVDGIAEVKNELARP